MPDTRKKTYEEPDIKKKKGKSKSNVESNEIIPSDILLDRIKELEKYVISVHKELKEVSRSKDDEIGKLRKKNLELTTKVNDLELKITDLNQYGRRECVEFTGIPETVQQNRLEKYVIDMLDEIGITVDTRDIVAAHRLGPVKRGSNRVVIVKFLNRKDAIEALKNKRKLNKIQHYKKIRIRENLCPSRRKIFNRLLHE